MNLKWKEDKDTLKLNRYSTSRQLFRGVKLPSRTRKSCMFSRKTSREKSESYFFGARKPVFFRYAWITLPVRGLQVNHYFLHLFVLI